MTCGLGLTLGSLSHSFCTTTHEYVTRYVGSGRSWELCNVVGGVESCATRLLRLLCVSHNLHNTCVSHNLHHTCVSHNLHHTCVSHNLHHTCVSHNLHHTWCIGTLILHRTWMSESLREFVERVKSSWNALLTCALCVIDAAPHMNEWVITWVVE